MMFVSKKKSLRLIKKPTDVMVDENRRVQVLRGEKVEFANGRYRTDNQDLIDWLIGNPEKGIPPHEDLIKGNFTAVDEGHLSKMKTDAVQMISGASSTGSHPVAAAGEGPSVPQVEREQIIQKSQAAALAEMLEESEKRTDAKIASALSQIMAALQPKDAVTVPAPKKVFSCPICGEEFTTGFAVGRHKKSAHAETYVSEGDKE